MSDNIKLVIEIPKSDYNAICANKEDAIIAHDTCRRIANNSTPLSNILSDIKGEIDELDYLVDDAMYSDNETRVHNVSYLMDSIYEIINKHIGKTESRK